MHTILVVDDSVTIQQAVEIAFGKEPFTVVRASSGLEGMQRARAAAPAAILVDHTLPDQSGYDFAAALKADPATAAIPVLMLSHTAAPYDEARAAAAGLVGHVPKPFDCQGLLDRVRTVLGISLTPLGSTAPAAAASMPRPSVLGGLPRPPTFGGGMPARAPTTIPPAISPVAAPSAAPIAAPAAVGPGFAAFGSGLGGPSTGSGGAPSTGSFSLAPGAGAPAVPQPPTVARPLDPFGLSEARPAPAAAPVAAAPTGFQRPPVPAGWQAVGLNTAFPPTAPAPAIVPPPAALPPAQNDFLELSEIDVTDVPEVPPTPTVSSVPGPAAPATPRVYTPLPAVPGAGMPSFAPISDAAVRTTSLDRDAMVEVAQVAQRAPPSATLVEQAAAVIVDKAAAALSTGATDSAAPSQVALSAEARSIVERIAWEVVPELAEVILREEIQRLLAARKSA